jgi:hypothetical protein
MLLCGELCCAFYKAEQHLWLQPTRDGTISHKYQSFLQTLPGSSGCMIPSSEGPLADLVYEKWEYPGAIPKKTSP